jgi:hypothetical protein
MTSLPCPHCEGQGWYVGTGTGTDWECCGNYVCNQWGEAIDCCGQPVPIPVPIQEQVQCEACGGTGVYRSSREDER